MQLTNAEKAMRDGADGPAVAVRQFNREIAAGLADRAAAEKA